MLVDDPAGHRTARQGGHGLGRRNYKSSAPGYEDTVTEEEQKPECSPAIDEKREEPPPPRWRPASEPTCCGSGCSDCPF